VGLSWKEEKQSETEGDLTDMRLSLTDGAADLRRKQRRERREERHLFVACV